MVKQLKVHFGGSFQCRLATEHDSTDSSPTDPYGDYGVKAKGWTFAYREARFDRYIRFSSPIELRTALMDPWVNVVVRKVECDRGSGLVPVSGDALLNKLVSLGSARFDTKQGEGDMTREALIGLKFSIATMLQADPA
jgi:hypothetical protein